MKTPRFALIALVIAAAGCVAWAQEPEGLLELSFRAVAEAEAAGGDISGLVDQLNHALGLIDSGDAEEADRVLVDVASGAAAAREVGVAQGNVDAAIAIAKVVLLLGLAAGVWVYGDRAFWGLWMRAYRGWVVEQGR